MHKQSKGTYLTVLHAKRRIAELSLHEGSFCEINAENLESSRKKERIVWGNKESRIQFFEKFSREHGISNPIEWGKVTNEAVWNFGGRGILRKFNGSLVDALRCTYSGTI